MNSLVNGMLGHAAGKAGQDGIGQNLCDDVRYALRFRKCSQQPAIWQKASQTEQELVMADALLGRFADEICGIAEVDGRGWIALERDWHGFPDPPRYAFFAFEGSQIWAAADFHVWPSAWRISEVVDN